MAITNEALALEVQRLIHKISDELKIHDRFEITTCDAPNWKEEQHQAMLHIARVGIEDCIVTHVYKYECWDWTVRRRETCVNKYKLV